jgi:hypothetical protein
MGEILSKTRLLELLMNGIIRRKLKSAGNKPNNREKHKSAMPTPRELKIFCPSTLISLVTTMYTMDTKQVVAKPIAGPNRD